MVLMGVVLAGVILFLHSLRYASFIADDAYISLRYAQRLVEGHGLTWTDGQPVEGYSNFLWVLICSALGWLGMDWEKTTYVAGLAGSFLAIWGISRTWVRAEGHSYITLYAGMLILALSAPMAVWTHGGLEQTLFAAMLALGIGTSIPLIQPGAPRHFAHLAGTGLGLACLTRPDGILIAGSVGLALLLSGNLNRRKWQHIFIVTAWVVLLFGAQMVFRILYYGDWLPNTARAKVSISTVHINGGIEYLLDSFLWQLPVVVIAMLMLIWLLGRKSTRTRALIVALPFFVFSLYIILVGGDIFPGRRFFVTLQVPLALLFMLGLDEITRISSQQVWRRSIAILTGLILVAYGYLQYKDPQGEKARKETWEADALAIGKMLKTGYPDVEPLMAIDAAGALPFATGWPCVDMLGLNDAWLAKHKPQGFGRGLVGHELGNGEYVMDKNPDIIMFGGPPGSEHGIFLSGREMEASIRFHREYAYASFQYQQDPEKNCHLWIRKEGKLGIQRERNRVVVPASLLNARQGTIVKTDEAGRFMVEVGIGAPVGMALLQLAPGKWILEPPCVGCADMALGLRYHHQPFFEGVVGDTLSLSPENANGFDLILQSRSILTHQIYQLALRQVE